MLGLCFYREQKNPVGGEGTNEGEGPGVTLGGVGRGEGTPLPPL